MAPPLRQHRRRAFLAGLVLLSPAGAFLSATIRRRFPSPAAPGTGPIRASRPPFRLETAASADFKAHLGSRFRMRPSSGAPIVVELAEVQEGPPCTRALARPSFSVVFRGPRARAPISETVVVEHDRLGTFSLFVVPVGRGKNATRYEAVFG